MVGALALEIGKAPAWNLKNINIVELYYLQVINNLPATVVKLDQKIWENILLGDFIEPF
jgi:hypothetical protein